MAVEVRACSRAGLDGGSECGLCRWPGLNGGSECGLWDPSLSLPWLLGGVGGNRRCSSVGKTKIRDTLETPVTRSFVTFTS